MSTYTLSGSGTQALSANVTALHITINTPALTTGKGKANPTNYYGAALIRFGDGAAYFSPFAVTGGPQWIGVPVGCSVLGYNVFGATSLTVVEVIGGTPPFGSPTPSVENLSDVTVSGVSNGQVLTWVAAASKWENVSLPTTPASGAVATTALTAAASSITFTGIPGTGTVLIVEFGLASDQGSQQIVNVELNGDTTAAHYASYQGGASSKRILVMPPSVSPQVFVNQRLAIASYAVSAATQNVQTYQGPRSDTSFEANAVLWTPSSAAAVTGVKLLANTGNFKAGSWASVWLY